MRIQVNINSNRFLFVKISKEHFFPMWENVNICNWIRTLIKWHYHNLGILYVSHSQHALAFNFTFVLWKHFFPHLSIFQLSSEVTFLLRVFRKSFPSKIVTAAYSNKTMMHKPHKTLWYLNQAGSSYRGSQFTCSFRWSQLCGLFVLLCSEIHSMAWTSTKAVT